MAKQAEEPGGLNSKAKHEQGKAPRLDALDAPRWLASCMIVAYHRYEKDLGMFGTWGSAWTQFFFVLSGFVLGYVEMARPVEKAPKLSQLQYVRKRLVTVYPTYVFALVCRVLQWNWGHAWFDWAILPMHLFLMQAWVPICTWKYYQCASQAWNGVAWFMSALIPYWLLLRPLAKHFRDYSLRSAYVAVVFLWLWSVVPGTLQYVEKFGICSDWCYQTLWSAMQAGPLGYIHVFVSGVVGARVFILTAMCDRDTGGPPTRDTQKLALQVEGAPRILRYGVSIGYLCYALCVVFAPYKSFYLMFHNGGILPIMLLVLLGGAIGEDPIAKYVFRRPLLLTLGRISYCQYLLQDTVWDVCLEHLYPQKPLVQKILYPFCLLASAYCCERFVARPYIEWQRWREEKHIKGIDGWAIEKADFLIDAMLQCFRRCRYGEIESSTAAGAAPSPLPSEPIGKTAPAELRSDSLVIEIADHGAGFGEEEHPVGELSPLKSRPSSNTERFKSIFCF